MPLKKTIIEPSWEAKYSFSPAVITEGGKTIWLAGHVGFVDDTFGHNSGFDLVLGGAGVVGHVRLFLRFAGGFHVALWRRATLRRTELGRNLAVDRGCAERTTESGG